MPRTRLFLGLFALLACCLASCSSTAWRRVDWRWPVHVQEQRDAWKEATGRDLDTLD